MLPPVGSFYDTSMTWKKEAMIRFVLCWNLLTFHWMDGDQVDR